MGYNIHTTGFLQAPGQQKPRLGLAFRAGKSPAQGTERFQIGPKAAAVGNAFQHLLFDIREIAAFHRGVPRLSADNTYAQHPNLHWAGEFQAVEDQS